MTQHDRRHDADERLAQIVAEQIGKHFSVIKNGETWREYLGKVFSPQNLILITIFVFNVGGAVRDYQAQLSGATNDVKALGQQVAAAKEQIAALQNINVAQTDTLDRLILERNELSSQVKQFKEASLQFDDRLRRTVTRQDFDAALNLRVLPRLERMERALGTK